jgi:hypothetical protein
MARTSLDRLLKNLVKFSDEPMFCGFDGEQVVIRFHGQAYVTTKEDVLELVEIFREAVRVSEDMDLADEFFMKAAKLELAVAMDRSPTRH